MALSLVERLEESAQLSMPTETPIHDPNDITLGEVYRYLLAMEQRTLQQLQAIDDRMSRTASEYLRQDIYETKHAALQERVRVLEQERASSVSSRQSMIRNVVAAIAGTVVGSGAAAIITSIH